EFRFAYAPWAGRAQVAPPPLAPTLGILSDELSNLFDRAFRPGSEARDARPIPAEWRSALTSLQKELVPCPVDPGHKAPRHYGKCPWCEIMGTGGPNFFMGVAIIEVVFAVDVTTLRRLWSKIDGIRDLSFGYARPQVPPG